MKRSKHKPSDLLCLPNSLLTLLCSYLDALPALAFVSEVVHMPDLRVPWSRVAQKRVLFVREPGSTLAIVHRLAVLPQLLVLEASVSKDNMFYLQPVLHEACGLEKLALTIPSYLLGKLEAITPPGSLRDLALVIESSDFPIAQRSLVGFLRTAGQLSHLSLSCAHNLNARGAPWAITDLLPDTILALAAGNLQSLSLEGAFVVSEDVLCAIVNRFPDLQDLRLKVITVEGVRVLSQLQNLRTCTMTLWAVDGLTFVEALPRLEVLRVELETQAQGQFSLPSCLRELCCQGKKLGEASFLVQVYCQASQLRALHLPAASLLALPESLLTSVRTLKCTVNPTLLADVLRLAATLRSLCDLCLEAYENGTMKRFSSLCSAKSTPEFTVTTLKLEQQDVEGWTWRWLRAFPRLSQLECQRQQNDNSDDDAYVQAFRSCPCLRALVDRRSLQAITVHKREDGSLVKRHNDSSKVLVLT